MGRKAKLPNGRTRTILLRMFQIDSLSESAERLGVDLSDDVRAAVDFLHPLDPDDARVRTESALALRVAEMTEAGPGLIPAMLAGWQGREVAIPLELAKRPALAAMVDRAVRILRRLVPPGGGADLARPPRVPDGWAAAAPRELLVALACTAVRVAKVRTDGRPDVFLAAGVVCGGIAAPGEVAPESQYHEPAEALATLVRTRRVREESKFLGEAGKVLNCRAFRIDWAACKKPTGE